MAHSTPQIRGPLLFICNVGWFFISHRLALAIAAKAQGYDVHVACDIEDESEADTIRSAGLTFHRIPLSRGGLNPLRDLFTFFSVCLVLLRVRPAVIHNISIKPVVYASIAARLTRVRGVVNAISGLGYLFIDTERASFVRRCVRSLYRIALGSRRVRVIFQNEDDRSHFVGAGLVRRDQTLLIAGSGVDIDSYAIAPEPSDVPIRIVFPARMLADKGVREFAAAAALLTNAGFPVECLMAGGLDLANPASLSAADIRALEIPGLKWLGHVADMSALLKSSHIVCLPSYREGLPRALIEACAAGRPIVATDVPGCRDVVRDGINGFLVPARDAEALYRALSKLVLDKDLRIVMGSRARAIAVSEYGIEQVVNRTLRLYQDFAG